MKTVELVNVAELKPLDKVQCPDGEFRTVMKITITKGGCYSITDVETGATYDMKGDDVVDRLVIDTGNSLYVPFEIMLKAMVIILDQSLPWPEDTWKDIEQNWDLNLHTHDGEASAAIYRVVNGNTNMDKWRRVL